MAHLTKFLRKSPADQRMLALAAILHVVVTIAVRALPLGRVRQILGRVAAIATRRLGAADGDARVAQAVRTVSSVLPGATCLTEALVANCLLTRSPGETTLCFGVSRVRPAERPFDAHAWLERRGATLIGARAIAYDPLRPTSRCVSSPLPR